MKIAMVGQPEYFRFCYEDELNLIGQVREFPIHFRMKEKDFVDLIRYQADFNIFFRGEYIPARVLTKLKGHKIALSSEPFPRSIHGKLTFTRDSLKRYLVFRDRMRTRKFDYVFHYDAASLEYLRADGLALSGDFPFPVATHTYKKVEKMKSWDLFFIGRSTAYREKYFSDMKNIFNFLHICHGIWGPPLCDYINRSKISLNVHAEQEISWEPRVQMLLACGSMVISEKLTPNNYLRPGIDYIEVDSPKKMKKAVQYYLAHEAERNRIATAGMRRIGSRLNGRENFRRLIEGIQKGEMSRFEVGAPALSLGLLDFSWGLFQKGRRSAEWIFSKSEDREKHFILRRLKRLVRRRLLKKRG